MKDYALPAPLAGEELRLAIDTILRLFDQALPRRLWLPLLAGTFRIAVDNVDFSFHLAGVTGKGKTSLASLFAQFFGAGLHDRNLSGSWLSTSNATLALMALAKNVLLPIDDFVPTGSRSDIERANREADRVFRAQGNRAGRGRCTRDGTLREGRAPQCLPVSTGEQVPEGHSLNARLLTLEVGSDEVLKGSDSKASNDTLTCLQEHGKRGTLAGVMASFLAWLAPRYEGVRDALPKQRREFREVFRGERRLFRAVDIAADLLAGFCVFLDFCQDRGVITEADSDRLVDQMEEALDGVLDEQTQTTEEADPVSCYLDLLVTALTTGYAHLKDRSNKVPPRSPELWGWKETVERVVEKEGSEPTLKTCYAEQGKQIGWVDEYHVFLQIEASLVVVQKLAMDSSLRPLPLTKRSLGKALQARGLLRDTTKDHYTAKVTVLSFSKRVLQIEIASLRRFQRWSPAEEKCLDELLEA